jgi:hypothetical protein
MPVPIRHLDPLGLASDFGRWSAGTTSANAIIILGQPNMGFLMPTAVTYASSWSAGRQTLQAARRRLAPDPSARLWTNSIGTTRGPQMATGFASCSGCAGDPKGERARVRSGTQNEIAR